MKNLSLLCTPLLFSVALILPDRAAAQPNPCDGMSMVVEWGCLGESNGWAAVDQVIGATNPTEILWSTGETVQFITDLPSGDHWVMVTDANGCFVKEEFTVDCEKDCELEIELEYGCEAEGEGWATITEIEYAEYDTYVMWSTGETTMSISGLSSGDYWVKAYYTAFDCEVVYEFTITCDSEPCQLRTQTMGGWGAPANGNNPGVYRDMHFDDAFPAGLTIGCDNTLTLTSAEAVEDFLPSGGQPQALPPGDMVDPNYNNVLAGQLVALTLSVGFDANDPDFGSGGLLADAVINTGMFSGWTVQELLDEANSFIGGCGSTYTASQLNGGLTLVNENFVDGTTNNGNVDCAPMGGERMLVQDEAGVQAHTYPVPATDLVNVEIVSNIDAVYQIRILDALGRTAIEHNSEAFDAASPRTIVIPTHRLDNGTYLLNVIRNGAIERTERIIISR